MAASLVSESFFDDKEKITVAKDEVLEGLPIGYRFIPRDYDLISCYLRNKIMGFQLPSNVIKDIDFYNLDPLQFSTSDFEHGTKKNEAYYFTETEKMYSKTDRTRRSSRNGYWKASGKVKEIKRGGRVIGLKTIFVFYWRNRVVGIENNNKSSLVMHEFRVHPTIFPADQLLDEKIKAKMERYVICRIINKDDF